MSKLVIVDYGLGNLHSVHKALLRVADEGPGSWEIVLSRDPSELKGADRVVFPGVGAMRDCMGGLEAADWVEPLSRAFNEKPFFAICVGMQALLSYSEENSGVQGLGWVEGVVKRFDSTVVDKQAMAEPLKVPHMGWNQVQQKPHALWAGIEPDTRFCFVHSYYVSSTSAQVTATCEYGVKFSAAIGRDNWFAVQFHPEKSHTQGLRLLKNFLSWNP